MRGLIVIPLISLFILGCTVKEEIKKIPFQSETNLQGDTMKLYSDIFANGDMIPRKYTCQGEDINPPLKWEDVPEGTKSFALIFDDPDAKQVVGYTWVHWLVKDIPADVTGIDEDSVPGTEVVNSFGRESYGGPCPPSGVHRYLFKLYALDVETFEALGKADFYKQVEEHKIEEAVLMGKYKKS